MSGVVQCLMFNVQRFLILVHEMSVSQMFLWCNVKQKYAVKCWCCANRSPFYTIQYNTLY